MRHLSIDILRTAAIFMMVVVHFVENLSATYETQASGGHPLNPWWLPAGLAAPLFTLLTGVSYAIWLGVQQRRGVADAAISRRTVRRGLFLLGLGVTFNVLVWLPEDTFNWDVLTLIGTAMLMLAMVRHVPLPVPVGIGLAATFVAPVLRSIADYPAYWQNYHFDYDFTLSDVTLGFLAVGYFPVCPWLLYPLVGFVVGRTVFRDPTSSAATHTVGSRTLLMLGGLLLSAAAVASLLSLLQTTVTSESWRPPGWTMFLPLPATCWGPLPLDFYSWDRCMRWSTCRRHQLRAVGLVSCCHLGSPPTSIESADTHSRSTCFTMSSTSGPSGSMEWPRQVSRPPTGSHSCRPGQPRYSPSLSTRCVAHSSPGSTSVASPPQSR